MELVNLKIKQFNDWIFYGQYIKINFEGFFVLKGLFNNFVLSFDNSIEENYTTLINGIFSDDSFIKFTEGKMYSSNKIIVTSLNIDEIQYTIETITIEQLIFENHIVNCPFEDLHFAIYLLEELSYEKYREVCYHLINLCCLLESENHEKLSYYLVDKGFIIDLNNLSVLFRNINKYDFIVNYLEKHTYSYETLMLEFLKCRSINIKLFDYIYNKIEDFNFTYNELSFIDFCIICDMSYFIEHFLKKSVKYINKFCSITKLTPLLYMICSRQNNYVEILLKYGAEINTIQNDKHVLDYASDNQKEFLISHGSDKRLSLTYYQQGYKNFFEDLDTTKIDIYISRFLCSVKNKEDRYERSKRFFYHITHHNLKLIFQEIKYKSNKAYNVPELSDIILEYV